MKSSTIFIHFLLVCFLFLPSFSGSLKAQNVETAYQDLQNKIKGKPTISGGIAAQMSSNYAQGIPERTTPFNWRLNANLNLQWLGMNIPLSAAFSNGATVYNYQLPSYSFYGISPTYKWATLHLGDRSMNFSKYTLNGQSFKGVGAELKPGKFRFSGMYGRLRRADASDFNSLQNLDTYYKRNAWAFKAQYDNGTDALGLTLFKAVDDPNSIPPLPDTSAIHPQENFVMSVLAKKKMGNTVQMEVEYALSAFTRSTDNPIQENENRLFRTFAGLFQPHIGTRYNSAIRSTIGFNVKSTTVNLNYERVNPGYRTLGSLYFNNDLENLSISSAFSVLEKKLSISGNIGVERNNLSYQETNSSNRIISAVNATYAPNPQANFNLSYSNFRNTNKLRTLTNPIFPVDSIVLALVNQNISLSSIHQLGKTKSSSLSAMFSYQQANNIQNEEVLEEQNTKYYTGNLSFSHTSPQSKTTLSASLMGNYGVLSISELLTLAPALTVSKPLLKEKLITSSTLSYTSVYTDQVFTNQIITWRTNFRYQLPKKHQLSLNLNLINRKTKAANSELPEFTEIRANLAYSWSFSSKKVKKP